jgi:hypothetical protein
MPNIPFYADATDFRTIHSWLNECEELAFIVTDGPQKWRAVNSVRELMPGRACLWHVPSGPLSLLYPEPSCKIETIIDPWSSWRELRPGSDTSRPYFGAGDSGIIWLYVHPTSRIDSEGIGFSWFEWIGNHYRILGSGANPATEKFWRGLRRWVKKRTKNIPRAGPLDGPSPEVMAFPSALARFEAGEKRDQNPAPY